METLGTQIAKRINEFLFERGMSLYALAKYSGLSLSTLKNLYTKHTKSPSLALVYKICDGLDVTIGEFLDSPLFEKDIVDQLVYS